MSTSPRWDRLVKTLAEAGIENVRLDERGTSHSIFIKLPQGGSIEVHDKWWSKNIDKWVGWQVHLEDRESIVKRTFPFTKKRGEVAAQVQIALAGVGV